MTLTIEEEWNQFPVLAGQRIRYHRVVVASTMCCSRHQREPRIELLGLEGGYVEAEVFACCQEFALQVQATLTEER